MCWLLATLLISNAHAAPPVDFNRDVRPILVARCYACHGPDAEARKARLRLDEQSGPVDRRHPVIVPGDAAASVLIERVSETDPLDRMPPSGEPLSPEEIEILKRWINAGAKYDQPWAWKPLPKRDPSDTIDAFIDGRIAEAGLNAAPPAVPEALIRRLSFDLVGMPPTWQDIEEFVRDPSDENYAALVEQYLASPHFGETWARHWLDLVAYAETRGHEFDYPIPEAWRYRDWVVRAFNSDLPYDRFIAEQVAGDLLNPRPHPVDGTNEAVVGTAFWYLGQEVHAPTDVVQDHADRTNEQLIVFGQGVLGLTVACARCHDHKFDAISAKDYYALAAFTQSIRQGYAYQDPGGTIAAAVERLNTVSEPPNDLAAPPVGLPGSEDSEAIVLASFDGPLEAAWREHGHAFDGLKTTPLGTLDSGRLDRRLQGTARSRDFALDRRYVHAIVRGHKTTVRLIVEAMRMDEHNPLLFNGYIQHIGAEEEVGWTHLVHDARRHQGTRAHYELIDDGEGFIDVAALWLSDRADSLPPGVALPSDPTIQAEYPPLIEYRTRLADAAGEIPAPRRVLAAHEGFGESHPLYTRGNHRTPGEVVERSFLDSIAGEQPPIDPALGSGRLVLVDRLFDFANPFPARVMANRIWHHLFGRGIVASTDDFGGLGSPPTHPALLDWLAVEFRSGPEPWSVKALIRTVVKSQAYRRAAGPVSDSAAEVDPTNDLLTTFRVRRLRAEQLRDAILAVSGRLDDTVGGPSIPIHLTEFLTGRGRPGASGPVDGANRRSIYLGVRRNFADPMLAAFDRPTPNAPDGQRNESNVPAQALALMNDPLVHDLALAWAKRVLEHPELGDDAARVRRMSLEAFGRAPSRKESDLMLASLEDGAREQQFAALAHAMFNAKSFTYLD